VLRIEARKTSEGKWRSGLLSSADAKGNGFTQQFGYFEMRAKLPPGPGLWPAFWLIANRDPDTSAEIDIMEHYGVAPDKYESVMHVWPKDGRGRQYQERLVHSVPADSLYNDFHTFGAAVEPDTTTFYLDRVAIARTPTPPEHRRPMFILVDLALGAGWPIDQTPNPSYMYVDYIRAYAK
jgi:beta-glucanase (GH16 family)